MSPGPLSPDTHSAEDVVRLLDLAPLPTEGGWFRRAAESELRVPGGERRACSAIYFLVTPESFSALHRVDAVETWCFHAGDPLELLVLGERGAGRLVTLGADLAAGQTLQEMVPGEAWQGARLKPGGRWGLVRGRARISDPRLHARRPRGAGDGLPGFRRGNRGVDAVRFAARSCGRVDGRRCFLRSLAEKAGRAA